MRKPTKKSLPEDAAALFREAVRDATPLRSPARVRPEAGSLPLPVQSLLDVHDTLAESLTGPISLDQSIETGEELFYLRDGLGRNVLHKLRRGHWVVQGAVDLHGANRDEARSLLAEFLGDCLKRGLRCVRVIHGKGLRSPKPEPGPKGKVRQWPPPSHEVVALLATEALHLRHRQPRNPDFGQGFTHLVELEGLHDRFDLLHGRSPALTPAPV